MLLTPLQKQAVEYNQGPLLIIAGAGTGKTTTLVEKVKYLIKKKLARPEEILALTFTDKAAHEIEERIDKALPYGYFQMNIATFHAFCDRLLRNEGIQIGLSINYRMFTQAQMIVFLKRHLFAFELDYFRPLGNPNKFIDGLIQHFSRLRDEDIAPDEYTKWAKKSDGKTSGVTPLKGGSPKVEEERRVNHKKYLELAEAYQTFQRLKLKENILDFADLIFYALKLFRERNNVLTSLQNRYKYILVDEFQDTNIAQFELVKLLCPPFLNPKLTVIGDDNQSIYKFRGAAISNIVQFMDEYNNAKSIVLTDNFRSNQAILDTSYRLIKHNDPDTLEAKLKISKNLKSVRGKGEIDVIQFFLTDRVEKEADYVRSQIDKLKNKYQWRDFAILVRANNHADPFIRALSYAGIPYQFLGPGALFKQSEIKDLIAYLFVIFDITDSASLYRVLAMDFFDIDKKDLSLLLAFRRKTSLSLFEALEVYLAFFYPALYKSDFAPYKTYLSLLSQDSREKLYKIYQLIQTGLSLRKKDSAGHILYRFLEDSDILASLMNQTTEKEEKVAQNIAAFFDKLKNFEVEHDDATIAAVCDFITMSMELGESPLAQNIDWTERNAVNLLTVHSAKGLEFGVVFLVNLTQDRFPTRERKELIPIPDALIKEQLPEGDFHLQEERRLFYVGLTRARDRLFLCASQFYSEGKRSRRLSPFVAETIGENEVQKKLKQKSEEKKQLSFFDPDYLKNAFGKKDTVIEKQKVDITTFSYSQLETYTLCPLRYKYQYVLRIPIPANAAASFGETIHKALEQFYSLYKQGEKPDKKILLEFYKQSWIPVGYTSKAYEAKMKKEGIKLLEQFYDNVHNEKINIIDLERWFKIKLNNDIAIIGKIDRVDRLSKDEIEIVDYKTGKMPTLPELKKSLQLGIYALAAQDKGLYHRPSNKVTLTFYFLQQEKGRVSIKKTAAELIEVKDKVKKIVGEIRQSNFEPHVGPWCQFCPFKINCEAWQ